MTSASPSNTEYHVPGTIYVLKLWMSIVYVNYQNLPQPTYWRTVSSHADTTNANYTTNNSTHFITEASLRKAILSWIVAFSLVVCNITHINEIKVTYVILTNINHFWFLFNQLTIPSYSMLGQVTQGRTHEDSCSSCFTGWMPFRLPKRQPRAPMWHHKY